MSLMQQSLKTSRSISRKVKLMTLNLKGIVLALCLGLSVVHAAVEDYQKIYQEEQKEFNTQMSEEIKKSISYASKKVQELYGAINYQPIWVDKDYLTQYAELLVHELKSDFKKGLHPELVATYKKLVPDEEKIFTSESWADKVKIELGLMNLYVKHIGEILKERESKHTALSLLQ